MPRVASEEEIVVVGVEMGGDDIEFFAFGSNEPIIIPTRESFHLGRARAAYLEGRIEIEEFEELADHVIRKGGYLSETLEIPFNEKDS